MSNSMMGMVIALVIIVLWGLWRPKKGNGKPQSKGWIGWVATGLLLMLAGAIWLANLTGVTKQLGAEAAKKKAEEAAWVEQQMLKHEQGRRATLMNVGTAAADNEWRRLNFSEGVSVEVPRNWIVGSESERITVDAYLQSQMRGIEKNSASRMLTFFMGDRIAAQASFRLYRTPEAISVTQSEMASASHGDLLALDSALRKSAEQAGEHILQWNGTATKKGSRFYAFVTEYRAQFNHESFPRKFVRVRVYDGSLSFAFLLNYDERVEPIVRPLVDRMIHSLDRYETSAADAFGDSAALELERVIENANNALPRMIDKETRLDRVTSPSALVLQNNYTMLNIDTPLPGWFAQVEQELRKTIVGRACSSRGVTRLLERGITNVYSYNAADGKFIGSVTVTKADCKP